MTRSQQIRKALELLAPARDKRGECKRDIEFAIDMVEHGANAARSFRAATSKKGRETLARYAQALHRLRSACNSLDPAIKPWLSVAIKISRNAIDLGREIEMAKALSGQRSRRRGRDASHKEIAVAWAHDLLDWWGHEASVTRRGKWAQLATILLGGRDLYLIDHMSSFNRSGGPGVLKLRGPHSVAYISPRRESGTE
jgi:hypothetical protein